MSSASMIKRCSRCTQAAPDGAKRCPNCGERIRTTERRFMLYFALGALMLLLALIGLGMYILPSEPLQ